MKCVFRRRSGPYVLPVLLCLLAFACTKPQIQFPNVNNGDNNTNVVEVDTFAVKISTVFLDSFSTSGTQVQLLGRYIDPYFGAITSRSFSDIGVPSALPTLSNYSIYDSFRLIMRINKSFYGDTTHVQRFLVSQLTEVMNYPGTQKAYYSNNSIPFDPTILGSTDVQINPMAGITSQRTGDTVRMALPDDLGKQLFALLYSQSDTVKNPATFRGFFKGLVVYPDESLPGAVFGFNDTMIMRIYYHEPGLVVQNKTTDFRVVNLSKQFNQITADRTGTPVQSIGQSHTELPSSTSGNQVFFQPITSLYVKLLFPTITDVQAYQDYLSVMRAILIIKPVAGTYSPTYSLPPSINLALTTPSNTIGAQLNSGAGNLITDYLYGTKTSYSYDITPYIRAALLQGAVNNAKNGLILTTPANNFNTIFNRAVIGDALNPLQSNQISLKIYYASYY